jgi:hypothetical protein
VYLAKVNRYNDKQEQKEQQGLYREEKSANNDSVGRRRIEIENLLFGISIELSKIKIGHIEKTIQPPVHLGRKELQIENIVFFSQ